MVTQLHIHAHSFSLCPKNTSQAALKTMYLLQMGVEALASVILFFHHTFPVLLGHKERLTHMAIANLLVLLSSGSPLSRIVCKFVSYTRKVACSSTLCFTCVLSTYHVFILMSRRAEKTMLQGRAPKIIGPSCYVLWIFGVLMYIHVPLKITGPQDMHNYTDTQGNWFCSSSGPDTGFGCLWSISDVLFIGLMAWSSGSMLLLLHRHHQRMQYIHRAAHTILMLVVTFVFFFVLNSSFAFYVTAYTHLHLWLIQTTHLLASCFPTFSPFFLILGDPRAPRCCSRGVRNCG
uniref:Vomeronasal type-1 receptor n=1 Tax=Sus scrofa TaxID=9823 RepID=A0A8D0Z527_PIG